MDYFPLKKKKKTTILYHQFSNYMPRHIITTNSSSPTSPSQFSPDTLQFKLFVLTTALSASQAHKHACVPSEHGGQLQLQIHGGPLHKREEVQYVRSISYTNNGKDGAWWIIAHYRCEHTAAVEADRTWPGMLTRHKMMGHKTMQGGSREVCVSCQDLPTEKLVPRLLPLRNM